MLLSGIHRFLFKYRDSHRTVAFNALRSDSVKCPKGNDLEMASMRNVAGEILGAMAAVEKAEELGLSQLIIYYDYSGIEAWATGEWQAKKIRDKSIS